MTTYSVRVRRQPESMPVVLAPDTSVTNPVPMLLSIDTTSGLIEGPASTNVAHGRYFAPGVVVQVDGVPLTTFTVNSTEKITFTIPASLKLSVGPKLVTIVNPAPGGGTSSPLAYTVEYPVPSLTGLGVNSTFPGAPNTQVPLTGSGFFGATTLAYLGATALALSVISRTSAIATILAAQLVTAAAFQVTTFNPAPGGGTSGGQTFTVTNPAPVITSVTVPSNPYFGGVKSVPLLVTGAVPTTQAFVDGVQVPCAFVDGTHVTLTLLNTVHHPNAAFVSTRSITLVNGTPGGGTSAAATYTLTVPTYAKCWYHPSRFVVSAGKCTGWTDVSGNGYHLTSTGSQQATYVASAANGRPSARVDGLDDVFQSPTIATVSQPWNLFLDVAVLTQGASKYLFSTNAAAKVFLNALPTPIGFAGGAGGSPSGVLPYTGDFTSMNFALAGGNGAMICNGRTTLPAPAAAGAQDTFTQFYIGAQNAAGANGVNAEFQEVMLTSGTIPAGDLIEINLYREIFYRGYTGLNAQKINGVLYGDSRTFGTGQAYSPAQVMTMLCGPDAGVWINRGVSGITAQQQNIDFANTGANYSLTPVLSTTLVNFVVHDIAINDTNVGRTDAQIFADVVSIATKFYAWCHTNQTLALAAQARFIIKVFDAGDRGSGNTGATTAQKEAWRVAFKNTVAADTTTTSAGGVTRPLFSAKVMPLAALDDVTLCGTTSLSLYAGPTSAGDLIHLNTWGNLQSWRNAAPAVKALIALVP